MKSKNGRKVSIIVVLAVISLISILVINAISTAMEIQKKEEESSNKEANISSYDQAIAEQNNMANNTNEEELLEDKAREEGYIYPDEIVYADSAN